MQFEYLIKKEVPTEDSTSHEEKMMLYEFIKKNKPKVVVETGTHRGLTTLYMAHALFENGEGHLFTYDPFEWGAQGNFRKFPELEKYITYNKKPGHTCEVKDIDMFFCDGFHEKEEVLKEIDAIFPNLSKKATVFFHDTNGSNPTCDVPGATKERNLKTKHLQTANGIDVYENFSTDADNSPRRAKSGAKKSRGTNTN
jgi:predicted O-methyltransferase YrrM